MRKSVFLLFPVLLFCSGCFNQGDFGAKFCAVYRNYDSAAFHLQKYIEKEERVSAHYWLFLGVAEMYRGNIPEMFAAFEKAEQSGELFPELLLIRCNWYIQSGNFEKAKADYENLKKMLEKSDFSFPAYLNYRSRLLFKILDLNERAGVTAFSRTYKGDYEKLIRDSAFHLKKKLKLLEKYPSEKMFVLQQFTEPEFSRIAFGMTMADLYKLLGKPYKNIFIGGMQERRILVYHKEGFLIGFFFTNKSERFGEVKTAYCCKKHGADRMRLLNRSNSNKKYSDDTFYYTPSYQDPSDFHWVCVKFEK